MTVVFPASRRGHGCFARAGLIMLATGPPRVAAHRPLPTSSPRRHAEVMTTKRKYWLLIVMLTWSPLGGNGRLGDRGMLCLSRLSRSQAVLTAAVPSSPAPRHQAGHLEQGARNGLLPAGPASNVTRDDAGAAGRHGHRRDSGARAERGRGGDGAVRPAVPRQDRGRPGGIGVASHGANCPQRGVPDGQGQHQQHGPAGQLRQPDRQQRLGQAPLHPDDDSRKAASSPAPASPPPRAWT